MYKILIFDLDDTLTDDFENCKEAFKFMIKYRNEEYKDENFIKFNEIDKQTWKDTAKGKLVTPYENDTEKRKEWLRASRIIKYYGEKNITYDEAINLNNIYMQGMKQRVISRPNVAKIMEYLYKKNYKIIIATNGPRLPLQDKIKKLGIGSYLEFVFSAEDIGVMKPHKIYFETLLKNANVSSIEEILIIGDGLDTDIKGGIDMGIDTCWCNYNKEINTQYDITYEIHELKELMNIL